MNPSRNRVLVAMVLLNGFLAQSGWSQVAPPTAAARTIPAVMAARVSAESRARAIAAFGGNANAEKAVMRGLAWLKKAQNADGSWANRNQPAMTGFAILAFLGHGETPQSPEFGAAVTSGMEWLLASGTKFDGRLCGAPAFNQSGVYEHAIATLAVAEYYAMTRDERVVPLLTQAVGYIVAGQGADGGWMYSYDGTKSDTSVTGWQVQALWVAHLAGLHLPGLTDALDKAMLHFQRVRGPKGGFGYRTAQDRYSLTGVGVLCTYLWTQKKDPLVLAGADFIRDQALKDEPVRYRGKSADLYAWYYHTHALLMVGGRSWTTWSLMIRDELYRAQGADGSWPPTDGKAHGPEKSKDAVGLVYRTALCTLMLEAFYRYTPGAGK